MKLLTVYNICGLGNKENTAYYIDSIKSILGQKNIHQDLVISSCLSKIETIKFLKKSFPLIKINNILEKIPVNVSFNHTCICFDDQTYDGFLYIDSGISMCNQLNVLSSMAHRMSSGPYSMVCCNTNTDQGVAMDNIGNFHRGKGLVDDNIGKCVSIGSSLNLHCQIFSRKIKDYFGNIIPDIFAGHCTESTFSFICASINTRWGIVNEQTKHINSMDGASSGFRPDKWIRDTGRPSYDHPFILDGYMDRLKNPFAQHIGLGFEECRFVAMHNTDAFDDNMFCKNTTLKKYIKDNLYLKTCEFDYSTIQNTIH